MANYPITWQQPTEEFSDWQGRGKGNLGDFECVESSLFGDFHSNTTISWVGRERRVFGFGFLKVCRVVVNFLERSGRTNIIIKWDFKRNTQTPEERQ